MKTNFPKAGMNNNEVNKELIFWQQNRFNICIGNKLPENTTHLKKVSTLLNHVKATKDYYAIVERIKQLKNKQKYGII